MRSLSFPAQAGLRRNAPAAGCQRLLLAAGGCDFSGEVAFLLLDSLAESIVHKAGDFDRPADLTLSFLHRLGNRLAAVVDEGLIEEANLIPIPREE